MSATLSTITLSVYPDTASGDGTRSLAAWLGHEDRLRGHVTAVASAASGRTDGAMAAGVTDLLLVAVGSGGLLAVLIQAAVGWLAQRREDVTVKLTRPDGTTVELDVRRARDHRAIASLVESTVRALESENSEPEIER